MLNSAHPHLTRATCSPNASPNFVNETVEKDRQAAQKIEEFLRAANDLVNHCGGIEFLA